MISRTYDVLVLDPSPGALVAAAMLARDGLSVAVLPPERQRPAVGGYRFYRHDPPVVGFGGGQMLWRSLQALKFSPHELRAVRKTQPPLQVITSRHRLDLPSAPEDLAAEWQREFPDDAAIIMELLQRTIASGESFAEALDAAVEEAGQAGFLQAVGLVRPGWNPPLPPEDVPTWGEFLAQHEQLGHDARAVLRVLLRPFSSLDVVEDLPLPVAGMHLSAAFDGVYTDPNEEDPLLALLLRLVQAMRVEVLDRGVLEQLVAGRRAVRAAHFRGRDDALPVEWVITGGDPEHLLPLLTSAPGAYDRTLNRVAPSHFRHSIYLGVSEETVPPDLAENAVLIAEEGQLPEGYALLSTTPPGSPLAPDGCRALTLSTLVPYNDEGSVPGDLEAISSAMLDLLRWLMPWLERSIEVLQVPASTDASEEQPIPIDPRPVAWTAAVAPADDPVAADRGVSMPHRNVSYTGPSAFPALDLAGDALAGRLTYRLAVSGRKKN